MTDSAVLPTTFQALRVFKDAQGTVQAERQTLPVADLPQGEVTVQVTHSSLNYKDGMAVAGRPGILRRYPMTPGIDFAGTVLQDESGTYSPGETVIVTGWGVGERHDGGYATLARVPARWIVRAPEGTDAFWAMSVGTAGFTAMLAVMALEDQGLKAGEVLVTGAAGGVGSTAVALLARAGYEVTASTGRLEEADYLTGLGARHIIGREEMPALKRPMEGERWSGVVDTVGGATLAGAYASTRTHGSVAVCGLAGGAELNTTVYPMILRGVNLLGIDSVTCPTERRESAWARLAHELPAATLAPMTQERGLSELPALAQEILAGRVRGRTVIDVTR
ncbi:MDR family oxidoreductase [Deinococcus deserti]|uniref:Putative NADPH:quinone reductase putative Zn-dependent alcohol dehydrogenase n=1 Tax=Deinococcus deserti (strain DSM 17065 / CIP 109153 / LMG 22923 / VCD115) TaxID=546414 RepID=C1CV86_DEIDV|nr:MDR family oxidoreductase [Deinococcus deserti]ACO46103.2 putative NADPH:quinone reductase; putative Zn-dependent alcohol dehydrogenase [Deinococcus deserti VCD115]